jgi:DEAD/DEAH box helicase domain protein
MVLNLMERPNPVAAMWNLLQAVHEGEAATHQHLKRALEIYRSLRTAGVLEHVSSAQAAADGLPRLRLAVDLPDDFALNAPLAPFALATMDLLGLDSPEHTLDVVSVVESTLDDPRPLLYAQQRAARGEAVAAMKAEGLDYDERMEALEAITWPQPLAELLAGAYGVYAQANPWVREYELAPKSVVREMVEKAMTFSDLISVYQLARSEGVLLRYLTDAYRALRQVVPEEHRTDEVVELIDWLGELVRSVDSSLLDEWEALGQLQAGSNVELVRNDAPPAERAFGADADGHVPLSRNKHRLRTLVRQGMWAYVEAIAAEDVDRLVSLANSKAWDSERFNNLLDDYYDAYEWLAIDSEAHSKQYALIDEDPDDAALALAGVSEKLREALVGSGRAWLATQILNDPDDNHDWRLVFLVDVAQCDREDKAVLHLLKVGEA